MLAASLLCRAVAQPSAAELGVNWTKALDLRLSPLAPQYSVTMSVHDAVEQIASHLEALLRHTTGVWELLVAFDACHDASLLVAVSAVTSWALTERTSHCGATLTRVLFLASDTPAWEAVSDNAVLRRAHPASSVLLLVQADVQVTETGWNEYLALPLRLFDDLVGVSARCAHSYVNRSDAPYEEVCDAFLDKPRPRQQLDAQRASVVIRDTVNRGPLALRAERMRALNFFDTENFHLGFDEHDLMLRAYAQHGWKSGRYPVGFTHLFGHGASSRANRHAGAPAAEAALLAARIARQNRTAHEELRTALGKRPRWWENRPVSAAQLAAVPTLQASRCTGCVKPPPAGAAPPAGEEETPAERMCRPDRSLGGSAGRAS